MGRKRHTAEQIIAKLREGWVELARTPAFPVRTACALVREGSDPLGARPQRQGNGRRLELRDLPALGDKSSNFT